MEWYIFALLAGVSWGVLSGTTKSLLEDHSVIEFTFIVHFLALLMYTPVFLYFLSSYSLVVEGLLLALLSGIFNITGIYLYNDSIKLGNISEEVPLTRTTPVFTAILGFTLLGESINLAKALGILLVTAGSMIVMRDGEHSVRETILKVFEKKAAGIAVLSAVVYSFASIIDRMGSQAIAPELYTFFIYLMIASGFLVINTYERNTPRKIYGKFSQKWKIYLFSSILGVIGSISIFQAFSKAEASLVVPLLQIQVFISIIIGREFFHEQKILSKITGSTLLIAGILLII